jgi:hypothetical protein
MKVNFVIAGTQKSGTTTLQKLLSQHPSVHMAHTKGTHFFGGLSIRYLSCRHQ